MSDRPIDLATTIRQAQLLAAFRTPLPRPFDGDVVIDFARRCRDELTTLSEKLAASEARLQLATEFETRSGNVRIRIRQVDANGEFWEARKFIMDDDGESIDEEFIMSPSGWVQLEDDDADTPGFAIISGNTFQAADAAFAALAAATEGK